MILLTSRNVLSGEPAKRGQENICQDVYAMIAITTDDEMTHVGHT